jgi:hypothetical protein
MICRIIKPLNHNHNNMRNNCLKAGAFLASALAVAPAACKEQPAEVIQQELESLPTITIEGTVSDERFTPDYNGNRNGGDYVNPNYSFAIDTASGRKAIQVEQTRGVTKESIEVLLRTGSTVEIVVPATWAREQIISITADQIKLK